MEARERYGQFLEIVRRSPWAAIEHGDCFPRLDQDRSAAPCQAAH
jgi:hypothetical protein